MILRTIWNGFLLLCICQVIFGVSYYLFHFCEIPFQFDIGYSMLCKRRVLHVLQQ
jgi:hypothetical protein